MAVDPADPSADAAPPEGLDPSTPGTTPDGPVVVDPTLAEPPGPDADLSQVEQDRLLINTARAKGRGPLLKSFVKLSGPGWLQSAITLGGGSLASSLYLGVIGGFGLLWLQPSAMILGIIMLAAIAYVTLSTRRRPFEAIKNEVNPALAWLWLIASMMANFIWCLPQYTLAESAVSQNLLGDWVPKGATVAVIFLLAGIVSWFYESGGRGIKIFEALLKGLVMLVVVSFMVVVGALLIDDIGLIGRIAAGFLPDFSLIINPGADFTPDLRLTGEAQDYWRTKIVDEQQDVMIGAFATAVGINMTFLLPYSMLARGWDRDFRGLAIFDLSTSLLLPFLLATTCVVVASASRFHAERAYYIVGEGGTYAVNTSDLEDPATVKRESLHKAEEPSKLKAAQEASDNPEIRLGAKLTAGYIKLLDARLANLGIKPAGTLTADAPEGAKPPYTDAQRMDTELINENERRLAASLMGRDSGHLVGALKGVFGDFSNIVFGVGIFAMGISTIIILMLINGFVFCEMLGKPNNPTVHRIGAFAAGLFGMLGPFIWKGDAALYLAVPTSVFGAVLLPLAYITFFLMMNNRSLLGEAMPRGGKRVVWNLLMGLSCTVALATSLYAAYKKAGAIDGGKTYVTIGLAAIVAAVVITHFMKPKREPVPSEEAPVVV